MDRIVTKSGEPSGVSRRVNEMTVNRRLAKNVRVSDY